MKNFKIAGFGLALLGLVACQNEQSIQEYYVANQEKSEFVAIDVPTSLFANTESLNAEQKETLETVKKINVLAFPLKESGENHESYETEKENLSKVLQNEKYQLLMKYGSGTRKAEIYFTGDEDAIDEFIVFGFDDERGMGLARILGDNMDPKRLVKLLRSLEEGDIDMQGLKGLAGMFKGKVEVEVNDGYESSTAADSTLAK
ncbi:DUF4252 domain-containing protein [Salegentibacter sp. HM20]